MPCTSVLHGSAVGFTRFGAWSMIGALGDLASGLLRWRLWSMLAWEAFRNRYHRTIIGPVWVTISFLAFVSVKIFIFGAILRIDGNYYAVHLTLGFMVWNYMSTVVNGGTQAFVGSRNWILGIRAPLTVFVMQNNYGALLNFIFVSLAGYGIAMWLEPFEWQQFLVSLGGMALVIFALFWAQLALAIVAVFFRDVIQLVATVMRITFFLTPILWLPDSLGSRAIFVDYNPFTHLIAIVRAPILDGGADPLNYYVVAGLTGAAIIFSVVLLALTRRRIPSLV